RTELPLPQELREKIALFCNVSVEAVIENRDVESIYQVPLELERQKVDEYVIKRLNLPHGQSDLKEWREYVEKEKNPEHQVEVALVGKYVDLHDAYISVVEALKHAGVYHKTAVNIRWVNAEKVNDKTVDELLKGADGILVPGGFGDRGIEGKIRAIQYARENKIPYLGLCLGMQCAVIEFARNVAGLKGANSTEFDPNAPHPVIDLMPEQKDIDEKGGTMRLGVYPCKVIEGTKAYEAYKDELVYERHRHRYEFNNQYRELLTSKGLIISGLSPDERLVEIIELKDHPYFVATQFHPEFKSRPLKPHPLFRDFVKAMLNLKINNAE
ncbi:MAG TPA: CTP synthase, partial [Caldanaerobacter subterraneus]